MAIQNAVNGIIDMNVRVITANETLLSSDHYVVCNSATDITVTLLSAANLKRKQMIIKNVNSGIVTVVPNGSELIDRKSSIKLTNKYDKLHIIADDSLTSSASPQWIILEEPQKEHPSPLMYGI